MPTWLRIPPHSDMRRLPSCTSPVWVADCPFLCQHLDILATTGNRKSASGPDWERDGRRCKGELANQHKVCWPWQSPVCGLSVASHHKAAGPPSTIQEAPHGDPASKSLSLGLKIRHHWLKSASFATFSRSQEGTRHSLR